MSGALAVVPDPAPLVSVLLVTYNSVADLDRCLSSLKRQQVTGGFELVVVDNASTDGSADAVEAWTAHAQQDFGVTLLRNDTNVGYAAANNQALAHARGRILLLLNPDAVMDGGCISVLVDHLTTGVGVGVASAALRNPDGTAQDFARRDITLAAVVWDLTLLGRRIDERWRGGRGRRRRRYSAELAATPVAPVQVDCPAAACVALWRDLVGGQLFDERLPLFFNDAELFGRIRDRGYRCEIVAAATAEHGYGTSHRRIDRARKRAEFVASLRSYVALRFPLRVSAVLTAVLLMDALTALVTGLWPGRSSDRSHARGTLGGLWLPGGVAPWLTRRPSLRGRAHATRARWAQAARTLVHTAQRRRRRLRLVRRIRLQSWLLRAPVELVIDRTADIGADIRIELKRGRPVSLLIGPRAEVNDGVLLRLWGGRLVVGHGALIRHGAVLIVKGILDIGPRVVVSRNAQVHADGTMRIGFGVTIAERATVIDSRHTFDDVPLPVFDKPVAQADITLEPFCFVGANTVVTEGVTIGRSAVVGALSLVSRDVPAGMLAVGSPALPLRPVTSAFPLDAAAPSVSAAAPASLVPHRHRADLIAAPLPVHRQQPSSRAGSG